MKRKGIPLSSLESARPLKNFDIVGFSLQYELSYTTVLNLLHLGGIPLQLKKDIIVQKSFRLSSPGGHAP